jgi:hypothetical protein
MDTLCKEWELVGCEVDINTCGGGFDQERCRDRKALIVDLGEDDIAVVYILRADIPHWIRVNIDYNWRMACEQADEHEIP